MLPLSVSTKRGADPIAPPSFIAVGLWSWKGTGGDEGGDDGYDVLCFVILDKEA